MSTNAKIMLMLALVACYLLQTTLVYGDARGKVQLQGAALEGYRVWHANNCQSCHQLYGFGGFLGPDLTNVVERIQIARLRQVLTEGSGRMPPIRAVTPADADALWAFLSAMNQTGQGEARIAPPDGGSLQQRLERELAARLTPGTPEHRGHAALSSRTCATCHVPFQPGVVGAPDQTSVVSRLGDTELRWVLRNGRPGTAMPPPAPPFSEQEIEDVVAFFIWEWRHRDALIQATETPPPVFSWSELPWWEYREEPGAER